jgi:methylphosphotriester-DNA--protein-cysteine methyltransferase
MKNKHCQWCDNQFTTGVSYQIYCSAICREEATREKIAQRYAQTRAARRVGKTRECKNCKGPLSVYNDEPLCSKCDINPKDLSRALKDIKDLFHGKDT